MDFREAVEIAKKNPGAVIIKSSDVSFSVQVEKGNKAAHVNDDAAAVSHNNILNTGLILDGANSLQISAKDILKYKDKLVKLIKDVIAEKYVPVDRQKMIKDNICNLLMDMSREYQINLDDDIQLIRQMPVNVSTFLPTIMQDDTTFCKGNYYFNKNGSIYAVERDEAGLYTYDDGRRALNDEMWSMHQDYLSKLMLEINQYTQPVVDISALIKMSILQDLQNIEQLHEDFLSSKGLKSAGLKRTNRQHRVTQCYHCQEGLDNSIQAECGNCGWIVCSCGACGCGYSKNI